MTGLQLGIWRNALEIDLRLESLNHLPNREAFLYSDHVVDCYTRDPPQYCRRRCLNMLNLPSEHRRAYIECELVNCQGQHTHHRLQYTIITTVVVILNFIISIIIVTNIIIGDNALACSSTSHVRVTVDCECASEAISSS